MKILGVSCYFHDAAAALIIDGTVAAAAAEERFTRKKHDNDFPKNAIEYCLQTHNLAANELDAIVFYEKPLKKFDRVLNQYIDHFPHNLNTFLDTFPHWLNYKLNIRQTLRDELNYFGQIHFVDHHLSHAASAYYTAPFKEAAIVCIDGVGEWTTTSYGQGKETTLELEKEIHYPHSLGLLYSTLTAFLGFKVNNDEYKVMGLAAYGDPKPFRSKLKKLVTYQSDGAFTLNLDYFGFGYGDRMFSQKLVELLGEPREAESDMTARYENIAASLQELLEEIVFRLMTAVHKKTGQTNLVYAGGVALNSALNGKILSRTPFKEWYIPPDPGDAGGAIGAALYSYYNYFPHLKSSGPKKQHPTSPYLEKPFSPYLGPSYQWDEVTQALTNFPQLKIITIPSQKKLLTKVATLLTEDNVIGWFQGRMEWGPRALGNRSILAQATTQEMQDLINAKVKKREMFRPFAPVILADKVGDYFKADKKLPLSTDYMLSIYPFKKKVTKKVPAVVHVDGTGRLQTIRQELNSLYYQLIQTYQKRTGIPLLLNTSFNVRGEPIVCTPLDAINCFLSTDIDYLVLDQYLISKD